MKSTPLWSGLLINACAGHESRIKWISQPRWGHLSFRSPHRDRYLMNRLIPGTPAMDTFRNRHLYHPYAQSHRGVDVRNTAYRIVVRDIHRPETFRFIGMQTRVEQGKNECFTNTAQEVMQLAAIPTNH